MRIAKLVFALPVFISNTGYAANFLRLQNDHPIVRVYDHDGDQIDDERDSYTYDSRLKDWIVSESSTFDYSTRTWTIDYREATQYDPVSRLLYRFQYNGEEFDPSSCILYEFDHLGRISREYYTFPPEKCEVTSSEFVRVFTYLGNTHLLETRTEHSALTLGRFDWSRSEHTFQRTYSSTGKLAIEVETEYNGSETTSNYTYDSDDNLFSVDTVYSTTPHEQYLVNFSYDSNGDLMEESSVKLVNGNFTAFLSYNRYIYDSNALTIRIQNFSQPSSSAMISETVKTYDLLGHLISNETFWSGSSSIEKFQY